MSSINRIMVAMSGGVDSSVAALLLKSRGYDCIGVTMQLHNSTRNSDEQTCQSNADIEEAGRICETLGIPHYIFQHDADFERYVIRPFVDDYLHARTPNPCINCNRFLKFDLLFRQADALGCSHIATGHYAQIAVSGSQYHLLKGCNKEKDQSYVLYFLNQAQLSRILFPLGTYTSKDEIRSLAEQAGFNNSGRHDSQDICFIPDRDYASFIDHYAGSVPGPGNFILEDGTVLGRHLGITHYTIGKRKGLGIPAADRLYVRKICPENNTVILGKDPQFVSVRVHDISWVSGSAPSCLDGICARSRYHQRELPVSLRLLENGLAEVVFTSPQRAVTPGQAMVFYSGEEVLGGATILDAQLLP